MATPDQLRRLMELGLAVPTDQTSARPKPPGVYGDEETPPSAEIPTPAPLPEGAPLGVAPTRRPPSGPQNSEPKVTTGPMTGRQPLSFYDQGNVQNNRRMNSAINSTTSPFSGRGFDSSMQVDDAPEPPQKEGQSELWSTREEYEALLPAPVRESMARRREGGFEVPFRPVPDHVLRVWMASGDNIDQAKIQWGYAQRDMEEDGTAPPQAPLPKTGKSELWNTREEYEALLPAPIRESMARRRSGGFGVPFRPVPDNVLRVWMAAGDNIDQAKIQWGYAQRDMEETRPSPRGALPGTSANPYPGPYRPGYRPGVDGLEDLAQRDTPEQDKAAVGYDIGERARQLIAEREARKQRGSVDAPASPSGEGGQAAPSGTLPDGRTLLPGERDWNDIPDRPLSEFEAAANNAAYRRYVTRMIASGQMNSTQVADLGDAESQNRWNRYVMSTMATRRRYAPHTLGDPQIDIPSWRDRLERGDITQEQADVYLDAELRQRERAITKIYGNAMTDETAARLSQAVDNRDLETVRQISADARRNNRLARARNYSDQQQNQRIVKALNDPRERAGFVYRTLATGTPEERSALAATLGDDVVYALEMQSMSPGVAMPAAGSDDDEQSTFASSYQDNYEAVERMVLDGNVDMAEQTLRAQYAEMYPDQDPSVHAQQAKDHLETMMLRMTYNQQGPGYNYSTHPRVAVLMRNKASEGWESFAPWAFSMGMNAQQAQAMYEQMTGQPLDQEQQGLGTRLWNLLWGT